MMAGKDKKMSVDEISELLELKNWTKTQLAKELGVRLDAILRWFRGVRTPRGPATVLMRTWLNEARRKHRKQPA